MDDTYFDQYDYYNFGGEYNKIAKGSGGHAKHKGKKQNLKYAPSGNVRLVVTNIQNAEKKEKQARQRLNSVWATHGLCHYSKRQFIDSFCITSWFPHFWCKL